MTEVLAVAVLSWFISLTAATVLLIVDYCYVSMKKKQELLRMANREALLHTEPSPKPIRKPSKPASKTFAQGA